MLSDNGGERKRLERALSDSGGERKMLERAKKHRVACNIALQSAKARKGFGILRNASQKLYNFH